MKAIIFSIMFIFTLSVNAENVQQDNVSFSPVLHSCSVQYSNGTPIEFVGGAIWTETAEGLSRGIALENLLQQCRDVSIYIASDNCVQAIRDAKFKCKEL